MGTDAAFAFGSEVVERKVAVCRKLPPLGGLGGHLKFKTFAPAITRIDNTVERHTGIISTADIVHSPLSATCIDGCRYICLAECLAPGEVHRVNVLRLQIGVAYDAGVVVFVCDVGLQFPDAGSVSSSRIAECESSCLFGCVGKMCRGIELGVFAVTAGNGGQVHVVDDMVNAQSGIELQRTDAVVHLCIFAVCLPAVIERSIKVF